MLYFYILYKAVVAIVIMLPQYINCDRNPSAFNENNIGKGHGLIFQNSVLINTLYRAYK